MKRLKKLFPLLMALVLNACTWDMERPTDVQYIEKNDRTWQQHLQKIGQITAYQTKGQIGYISPQERFSSRFEWHYHTPQDYTLKLYSLLSKSSLSLRMHPSGITVTDNLGRQQSATDAKSLLQEIIGMDVPLEQLTHWLKGEPTAADYPVGVNHLLAAFSYPLNGTIWTADYLTYHDNAMPETILLKNKTTTQTLKIRIDAWQF